MCGLKNNFYINCILHIYLRSKQNAALHLLTKYLTFVKYFDILICESFYVKSYKKRAYYVTYYSTK